MRYRCATSAKGLLMIPDPTSKGKTSEAVILAALVTLGKHVLIPWGEERYDLALDEGRILVRIQLQDWPYPRRVHVLQDEHLRYAAAARRWRLCGPD
jgi:PD-(D/E)XK endonuclease